MPKESPFSITILIRASVILAAGFLIYYPALNGEWLWDDDFYVTSNPLLHDPDRVWKAWFVPGSFIEYYPIEQTLQWIQWQLWGETTFGYHLTNVILHGVSGLLLWHLLSKFKLRWAWLGGLLFVLHPMNVESVAYISELKNTLSLPPFLLALCFFIDFEESQRRRDYVLALSLFLVAMLCKISFGTFPIMMLFYAWWKRGRIRGGDIRNATPFFIISVLLGATTLWTGNQFERLYPSHPADLPTGGFLAHVALVGWVISDYACHFFWPLHPLPMYPRWSMEPLTLLSFLPCAIWSGVFYLLAHARENWKHHLLLGLAFFVIMLLPFSGLMIVPYMNFTWVMDHFLYVAMAGLIGVTVGGMENIHAKIPIQLRPFYIGMISLVFLFLTGRSQDYAAVWTDRTTLWNYTIARNNQAWLAHYNLGNVLRSEERFDQAIEQYQRAIQLNPSYDWAHNNLGLALSAFPDRFPEAIAEFREAVRLRPTGAEAHNNLANVLSRVPGHEAEAISEYRTALRIQPNFIEARYNLGLALVKMPNQMPEARAEFQEVLRSDPDFEPAKAMLEQLPSGP